MMMNSFSQYLPSLRKMESMPLRGLLTKEKSWIIDDKETEKTFSLQKLGAYESIYTIGNGYGGTRGSLEEGNVPSSLPGTYIAGVFDKYDSFVMELVNAPNWLPFRAFINGKQLSLYNLIQEQKKMPHNFKVLNHERVLDLKQGCLYRKTTYEDVTTKHVSTYESLRFMSMDNYHLSAERIAITPENYSADEILVESMIDGTTKNLNEPCCDLRASKIDRENHMDKFSWNPHYEVTRSFFEKNNGYFEWENLGHKTKKNPKKIVGYATSMSQDNKKAKIDSFVEGTNKLHQMAKISKKSVKKGKTLTFDKLVSTFTSRDYFGLKSEPQNPKEKIDLAEDPKLSAEVSKWIEQQSMSLLKQSSEKGFMKLFDAHKNAWEDKKWKYSDFQFIGNQDLTRSLRFNIFHMLIAAHEHDEKASIPARTYSGEAYKGHVFWDCEIFNLPFFIYTQPKTARALLSYRYNTLECAQKNATDDETIQKNNSSKFTGAKYAWEAADSGIEETPKYGGAPNFDRIWTGDQEIHISSMVAFGIHNYTRYSGDQDFLMNHGLEVILQVARFWNSRLEWNAEKKRFDINMVIGPDEFHEHINNSAFTNYMARWTCEQASSIFNRLNNSSNPKEKQAAEAVAKKLGLNPDKEFTEWKQRMSKLFCHFDNDSKIIEEFEGYSKLMEIPIDDYNEHGLPKMPKNVVEQPHEQKGDKKDAVLCRNTKVTKQADVIMLCYLLGSEPLFTQEVKEKNYEYYEKRCLHFSSLSPSIHSLMGIDCNSLKNVLPYFKVSLYVDLLDNRGNADVGIHSASCGGTYQAAINGFGGLTIGKDNKTLCFRPWIPDRSAIEGVKGVSEKDLFEGVKYSVIKNNKLIRVEIKKGEANLSMEQYEKYPLSDEKIEFYGKEYNLKPNQKLNIKF